MATDNISQAKFLQKEILNWSEKNLREFPWRNTTDPYKICVAEIMLHQTFARKVVPIYNKFLKRYPNIEKLSNAQIPALERLIYPLGFLYRAKRLKELAKFVMKEHDGIMPLDKEALLNLPGVGEYTASAILCFAYVHQVPIIDANVVRVYSRFFGLNTKLPNSSPNKEMQEIALMVLPIGKAKDFNYAILDFAAAICTHYNPKHDECFVKEQCEYLIDVKNSQPSD